MAETLFPTKDADLVSFAMNYSAKLSLNPIPYGVPDDRADELTALADALQAAYNNSVDPLKRGPATIATKNVAKANFKRLCKFVSSTVFGQPNLTVAQIMALGLKPRAARQPWPAPNKAPAIKVLGGLGRSLELQLTDGATTTKRGKPQFVRSATIMSYVGPTIPNDLEGWTLTANVTKTKTTIVFPGNVPAGSVCWISAFWVGSRGESGPACQPIRVEIGGGLVPVAV